MITDKETTELETLERLADELMADLAATGNVAADSDLLKLEQLAERSAKIAFGADRADLLSEQMQNLRGSYGTLLAILL
jgi:hypothetical protein